MGQRPAIPEGLSPEGKDFLEQTLIHDASERASASQLLDHLFTKVFVMCACIHIHSCMLVCPCLYKGRYQWYHTDMILIYWFIKINISLSFYLVAILLLYLCNLLRPSFTSVKTVLEQIDKTLSFWKSRQLFMLISFAATVLFYFLRSTVTKKNKAQPWVEDQQVL